MSIVTISREMGSGGSIIANALADKLGYTLVDGDTILKEASKYGLSQEAIEKADEKPPAFVESLDARAEIDFHHIQQIILEYALRGNVVIYGRGGQDILEGVESVLTTRIIAPFEFRVERWAEREWLDPDLSRILVHKSDQQRDGFIKYYFDRDWNDPCNYDLIINTIKISEEMAVDLIIHAMQEKYLLEQRESSKERLRELILRKKIEIELIRSADIEGYHLQIDIKEGTILLSGHIHSDSERDIIHEIINAQQPNYKIKDELKVFAYYVNPKEV
ncbi:MAG: cytidylate kinase-like family protein [Desulfuromonadaceae bacterium]|nr:cytidylate kinase-like family protein [Desulfuromonas sp.]MDY0184829.1 cytidylate kinase-like family protein [Desulfuromonadaceae bacterium]